MASERALKSKKSLKNILSRARKAPDDEEEVLPYRHVNRETRCDIPSLTSSRPVKQKYAQFHVTSDDINVHPSNGPPAIPERGSSYRVQRHTWPTSAKERRAGSYAFDTVPHLTPTPWELERSSRRPHSQRHPLIELKPLPKRIFEQLPREIYHSILDHLEALHVTNTIVDAVGLQTDMKALLLVNKRWHRATREHLYREIWLPSNDELSRRALSLQRSKRRLRLLLRTLKECEGLAYMVRHLRITADLAATLDMAEQSSSERRAAYELLSEVIYNCPNLELLSGYSPPVADEISTKLFIALSTRPKLKAHAWNIGATQLGRHPLQDFTPGDLLDCHDAWMNLETLVLCSSEDLELGTGLLSAMIQRLPRLKHLMLSHLDRRDFHNGTLLSLPGLKSLRLDHMEGVTDQGIEQLANSRLAISLERLSLVGLEITSLRAVQTVLNSLYRLQALTLVQDTSPEFPPGMATASRDKPLASSSLQYLHWDVLVSGNATTLLANSIANGHFPNLRKVKVPCDRDGSIQALCRPIAQEQMDASDLDLLTRFEAEDRYERFLRLSQIQAQLRVRESRQQPSFNVVIQDENKRVSATHFIGGYVGSMESMIEYSLEPDVEGSHYALIDFGDVEAPKWCYEQKNEMERSVRGEQMLDLKMLF